MPATLDTTPAELNLVVYGRQTFNTTLIYKDGNGVGIDVSGYTASMAIRSESATVLTLTNGSGITLGSNGTVAITITTTQLNGLSGVYSYDVLLTSGGVVTALVRGLFTVE